jgi:site-specific DNA-methyltransferase (adenine-specific)
MEITGVTYSTAHYEHYNQNGDLNYFEEIIDAMILDEIAGMNETFRAAISNLSKDKKRMTILSLLEKDIKLFNKIKALVDKDINKMEHIKDVVLMLREYVKIADVDQKKYGEVMTPLTLVKDMINTLPSEVWSNPNLKWLDPANGTGPYPIMVIYKLMNGLKDWEPDDEKRYKHIVENMIYVCELQPKNMFLYMCAVDPFDKYKLNVYTGSFLEKEFDYHMKNVWNVEKFDISLGNPPYNSARKENNQSSDIYNLFVDKCHLFCDIICMITPSRWFVKSSLSDYRNRMLNSYGLKYIYHISDNKFFNNADVKGGVSYFILDKRDKSEDVNFNGKLINLKNYDIIPNEISLDTFSLIDKVSKVKNIQSRFNSQSHFKVKTNDVRLKDTGLVRCYVSKQKGNIKYLSDINFESTKINKWKLLIPAASGKGGMEENFYNRVEVACPGEVCSESFVFFDFDSREELDNFKSYLTSDFFSYLVRLRKIKQHVTSDVFKWVPDISSNFNIDIFIESFNLSNDEKSLYENLKN